MIAGLEAAAIKKQEKANNIPAITLWLFKIFLRIIQKLLKATAFKVLLGSHLTQEKKK